MPELIRTLEAMNDKEHNQRKFAASLKGIQLDDEAKTESKTFDDVKRKALGITASADDVVSLQGSFASDAGFGIGMGLGYSRSN
ncbi:MAG: hypothetical protein EB170_07035 [Nitrosopumilaceae archaeon]|jgi:hypothetical protein|nr:hypothetical protein [Nitrosopumilaceae archaeon]